MKNKHLIKAALLSLFYIFTSCCDAQLSKEKMELIKPLLKIHYAESSSVGYAGSDSKIYYNFHKIKDKLTNEDLLILVKNSSNSLRFYSSMELIARAEPQMVSIYEYYKEYPLSFNYTQGCVGGRVDLAEMIYNEYNGIYDHLERIENSLQQNEGDEKTVGKLQTELTKAKKIIDNPNFSGTFGRIKQIKETYDKKERK